MTLEEDSVHIVMLVVPFVEMQVDVVDVWLKYSVSEHGFGERISFLVATPSRYGG